MHIVSYSEIDTFRQCPFKHQLAYKERWVGPGTSPALAKGTLMHAVLESHYLGKKAFQDGVVDEDGLTKLVNAEVSRLLFDENTGEFIGEVAELVHWMYTGYLERYGWDDEYKIVEVEHPFEIAIPGARGFRVKSKLDLLVEWKGKLWLWDHKTGRNLPKQKDLDLDVQFRLYTWGMRKLGFPVHGTIYNAIRTQRNKGVMELDERFQRVALSYTDAECEAVAVDIGRDAKAAYAKGTDIGDAPRHFNADTCGWRCDFTEPCLAGIKGIPTRVFLGEIGYQQDFTRH